ncbi:MAG: hypothetical protein KTR20_08350 [Cellvibrionaceae bacterium]|nr:hypothetical protein [Cellvibrionaceae bacterium]
MKPYFFILLLLFVNFAYAEKKAIYIVYPRESTLYTRAAYDIRSHLVTQSMATGVNIHLLPTDELPVFDDSQSLLVKLGPEALAAVAHKAADLSTIYAFFPQDYLNAISVDFKKQRDVGISFDQPLQNFIDVGVDLLEKNYKKTILVCVSENNTTILQQLEKIILPEDVQLKLVKVKDGQVAAKLIEPELYGAGVLVAVRDPVVWSGNSATWMLQQAYAYQVPVVGYSKSFLKAGAMVSLYASVDQVVEKTIQQIAHWLVYGDLGEQVVVYADFNVEFNKSIARALQFNPAPIKAMEALR